MAAKKSEAKDTEAGDPGPGAAEGGIGVERYFAEQDQVEGSVKNPKRRKPEKGEPDLITSVQACQLINGYVGYLMYNPKGLYRDAGKRAPAVHEIRPGELRFSREECETFAMEWMERKAARARLKAEEKRFEQEQREFKSGPVAQPAATNEPMAQDPHSYAKV